MSKRTSGRKVGTRQPLFCRVPRTTHEIIDRLAEETGYSKTEIVIIAIERLRRSIVRPSRSDMEGTNDQHTENGNKYGTEDGGGQQ